MGEGGEREENDRVAITAKREGESSLFTETGALKMRKHEARRS
jgi:hypothetical protein